MKFATISLLATFVSVATAVTVAPTTFASTLTLIPTTVSSSPPAETTISGPPPPDQGSCISVLKYYTWYHNIFFPECSALLDDCRAKTVPPADGSPVYIWSKTSCVAAATCGGTRKIETLERCRSPSFPTNDKTPNMSYNVYANIVGDCAWQPGGCPITKQKYIDWFYKALEAAGTKTWPTSAQSVIDNFWEPIKEWTATGETIPYVNFNDWLHYSNSA